MKRYEYLDAEYEVFMCLSQTSNNRIMS